MNELDNMKKIWQQQDPHQLDDLPSIQPIVSGKLRQKLELFQQEHGYGTSITGAVIMIIMAALIGGLAWKRDELFGFLAMGCLLFVAVGMIYFARQWRTVSLHKPEQNLRVYLETRYRQLKLLKWLTFTRILTGLTVAAFFLLAGGESPFSGDIKSSIGIAAFIGLAIFLTLVLLWWYRTQHPYRPDELRKEILGLLRQFQE